MFLVTLKISHIVVTTALKKIYIYIYRKEPLKAKALTYFTITRTSFTIPSFWQESPTNEILRKLDILSKDH